ncbi:hypothetical protein AOXY_G20184 [Acipenser oxyrinchus oxyrinchus]|uniref:Uncharacterized protein n=1 Tax=Acipenser oxyrinchus oxyrinchus TaxID=40147 RepID=A0AAD8D2F7_ACIOX|nr:hypothetical protein AOXY_G20184 [Acipenser oxyrinchus oxyrinchus]
MKNPVTLMVTLVSVQFVLYTISLCAPQWLVYTEGISQGLFVLCNAYEGFSSCVTVSAWMGTSSLSWMFLTASSVLSFITLFTIRPALSEGKRATTALILNILAALFCMSSLTCFLATLVLQDPYLLHNLGWSFYICCAALIYALVVNVTLGLVRVATAIEPATTVEKTSELAMSHIKSP